MLVGGILTALVGLTTKHGIVFDAGSSGSRIHVYTWTTGGGGPKDQFDLVSDDLLKIKPGLSAFKDKPAEAGASLAKLIEFAKSKIPADLVASTPMFLMATAGLRMVGEEAKDAILRSVCSYLGSTGFLFKCEWATLLDGREEGLYGWVTVNYLLNALYPSSDAKEPVGIIDLGGGSVQIVYPTPVVSDAPKEYSQQLDFAGRKHDLYIKSHLGFGLDAARKSVLELAAAKAKHPCLPKGATTTFNGMEMVGEGDWNKCLKLTARMFDRSKCKYSSCSWGGAYQPPLPTTFYGFSYLYDRSAAIGLLDSKPAVFGSQQMSRADINEHGAELCALSESDVKTRFSSHPDGSKANNFCGDVAYLSILLDNFGFPMTTKMTMTNKIKDVELVWTLGAMLAKSAELASGSGRGFGVMQVIVVLLIVGVAFWLCLQRNAQSRYRGHQPLQGHDSD